MEHSIIDLEAGTKLYYVAKNARMMEVYTNAITVEEEVEFNTIKSIKIGNKTYKVGDNFVHELDGLPSSYYICKIEKGGDPKEKYRHKYTFFSHLRNKTTTYVLPCLGKDKFYFGTETYLVNAYLDEERESIYLLYRFGKTDNYGKIETNVLNHPLFVKMHNTLPGFDLFEFKIPEMFLKDVELFVRGKYSKLSDKLKQNIKVFYQLHQRSRTWQILTKDKELVKEFEDYYFCSFSGVDLEIKPKLEEEVWKIA